MELCLTHLINKNTTSMSSILKIKPTFRPFGHSQNMMTQPCIFPGSKRAPLALSISAVVLGLAFTGAARAQNLVTNGDFSANAASFVSFPGYFGGDNPSGATGWAVGGGGGINGTLAPGSGSPFAPATNVPSFLFLQGDVAASQAISTVGGTDYLFSFDAAARNGNVAGVSVFADNTQAASLNLDGTGTNYGWLPTNAFQRYAFGFTATGAQTIQFNSSGTGDHTTDITNVSVEAAGAQYAIGNATVFFTNTSGTSAKGFTLTGNTQTIYQRSGAATYTGNITTDGSGGDLNIYSYGRQAGTRTLTFSGATIALGNKSLQINGTIGGNVDSIPDANDGRTTLNDGMFSTNANVVVTRGALHFTGNTQATIGGQILSGNAWNDFTMGGTSSVVVTGGVDFRNVASHLALNGGTLTTPSIWGNYTFGGASRTIFNGTRVVASADSADFLKVSNNFDVAAHSAAAEIANGGAIFDTNSHSVTVANTLADLPGNTGTLTKMGNGTLTLKGAHTYSGATTVNAGTLLVQGTTASPLLTDNFSTSGNPNTLDLNFNLAARQTGTAAQQNWTPAGNTQTGNPTPVQQPAGTNGDYLLLAFGASATLNSLPLSTANANGPLKVGFDMFKGNTGNSSEWTSFTMRSSGGNGFPVTGSGEFGFLYRQSTGIQIFNNGGAIYDIGSTTGGDSFGFYLSDSSGTGSPFAGNGTRLVVTQGANTLGTYALNTGMGTSYITFGSAGGMIGGVDNLLVTQASAFQTNVLSPTTAVSLPTSGATLNLTDVNQTVASLSGVAGSSVQIAPFSRLTVDGSANTSFDGVVSGSGSLTKSGNGALNLTSANTYTGATTVNGGTLRLSYDGGGNGGIGTLGVGSSITVNSGGTLLGGAFNGLGYQNTHAGDLLTINKGGALTVDTGVVLSMPYALNVVGGTISSVDGGFSGLGTIYYASTQGTFTSHSDGTPATISAQNFNLQGAQFNVTDGNGAVDLNVTGNLIGGGLVKNGNGVMALSGANSYTGVTTLAGGVLNVGTFSDYGVAGGLGNRAADTGGNVGILFRGGTLQYTGATAQSTNRAIRINADGGGGNSGGATIDASGSVPSATLSFTATSSPDFFENPGTRTLTLTGSNTGANTFGMAIGEAGGATSVVKNGAGTWVLSGANGYTGATTINGGTLALSGGVAIGDTSAVSIANTAGATLLLNASETVGSLAGGGGTGGEVQLGANTLTTGDATSTAFAGAITGTGGISKVGAGTLTLSGSSSYSGVTTLAGGVLNVGTFSDYGVNGSLGNRATDGGGNVGILFRGGTLQYTGATAQSTNRAIRINADGGGGSSGGATIDASGSVPSATLSFTATSSPDFFEFPGTRTLTLTGSNTGANTFAMAIGQAGSATSVVKNGAGTWVLSGANGYTGATTINGGKLLVSGSISGSVVSVNGGTLGGSGGSTGAVTVATGGTIAPGSSIGTLNTGPVSFADGSAFSIELGTTTGDQLNITGAGSTSGTVALNLSLLAVPVQTTLFTLINGTSPFSGHFSYGGNSLEEGEEFEVTNGGFYRAFTISYAEDAGNDVTLLAVPEPGSAALLIGGLAAIAGFRRRRE